jgi:hypothetical protein
VSARDPLVRHRARIYPVICQQSYSWKHLCKSPILAALQNNINASTASRTLNPTGLATSIWLILVECASSPRFRSELVTDLGHSDAFALNVGIDSWQPARVADAYAAAESSGTGFKLFLSVDMS